MERFRKNSSMLSIYECCKSKLSVERKVVNLVSGQGMRRIEEKRFEEESNFPLTISWSM
jgi:hypothetical protein